jgi:hypothetical protein
MNDSHISQTRAVSMTTVFSITATDGARGEGTQSGDHQTMSPSINGFYAAYLTGSAGQGLAMLVFKNGTIVVSMQQGLNMMALIATLEGQEIQPVSRRFLKFSTRNAFRRKSLTSREDY